MNAFAYATPRTPASAVELARSAGPQNARFLAGGIDLLGELKEHLAEPRLLVNIKALPETREITPGPDGWTVGANVTLATLAAHGDLRRVFPGLAAAAEQVGSPQMRNAATVGGNLAQHSRCWYYRHRDVRCLKKGGATCFARDGENKYHSLFTSATCLSPLVSNLATALTALDARVRLQRGAEVMTLTLAELYATAWDNPRAHNSLRPADLILGVAIPVVPGRRSVYLQIAEKSEFDWALASCAAAARSDGRVLRDVRVVLGVVAPIPWQVAEANALLEGKAPTDALAAQAADLLLRDAEPQAHNAYKVPVARTLVRRALAALAAP
jgi:xanthine dehydrogenase YagS FAD-binding subunit